MNWTKSIMAGTAMLSILSSAGMMPSFAEAGRPEAGKQTSQKTQAKGNGSGTLLAMAPDGKQLGQCPLKHTSVTAKISGYVSRVTVKQSFQNPFKEKIEAIYTFPLSDSGAVDDMIMKVGNRTIHGTIKKREEAKQIYDNAKAAGKVASLLDQERTNIFTQSVANIMPGEKVDIILQYVELLPYEAGQYRFEFPTVVGPRFIPFSADPSADRAQQAADAQKISPPIAEEGTRAGHDISIDVNIDGGVPVDVIQSKLHDVDIQKTSGTSAHVMLKDKETIPNRDFILTWNVAGDQLKSGYLTHKESKDSEGYFSLMIMPPKRVTTEKTSPKEMIFLIDCSGSQSGRPLDKAKETLTYIIDHMNPQDTFQVVAFSDTQAQLFDKPQAVNAEMKKKAQNWIQRLQANGGTWMGPAVEKVCAIPADANKLRIVTFMTDGFVGNDYEILGLIRKLRSKSRWFPFGTGNSVNRMLIDGIAKEGGGEAEYVLLNSSGNEVGKKFYDRIASPVLTDVNVDFDGVQVKEVFPKDVSDVWAEKPLYIKGRYTKPGAGTVTITGFAGGKPYKETMKVNFPENNSANGVLGSIWARAKVDRLMSEDFFGAQKGSVNKELREEIVKTALDHHIMTQYTSFVAVEEKVVTKGGAAVTVNVPVELPDGVSREGIFGAPANSPVPRPMAMMGGKGNVGIHMGKALNYAATNSPAQFHQLASGYGGYASPSALPPPMPSAPLAAAPSMPRAAGGGGGSAGDKRSVDAEYLVPTETKVRGRLTAKSEPPAGKDEEKQKEKDDASSKLDPALVNLAQKLARSVKLDGIEVQDGKVTIEIALKELSESTLKRLKALGLAVLVQTQDKKTVVGRIDVEKLNDLCLLEFVTSIKPAKAK